MKLRFFKRMFVKKATELEDGCRKREVYYYDVVF